MKTRSSAEFYVLSILFFFIAKLLIKTIPYIPSFEIVFFRALISAIVCIYVLKKNKIPLLSSNKANLFFRGLFGTGGMLSFFYSLQHLPLATATALVNLSPIFMILFATIFLGERIKFQDWILFLIAFMGVLLLKGFDTSIPFINFVIGISAAVFSSAAYMFVRRIKDKENPTIIVFWLSSVAIPVFLPLTIMYWVTPTVTGWIVILMIGILIQTAQICLTKALQTSKTTASLAHYTYLDVVISTIAGYFLFGEEATKMTIIGIGIIIGSVYLLRESHKKLPV
jgi:drug/metabolite transporter (DMT)-like permease